ncbi:MAG TPA: hypothetical protein EYQ47_07260 [Cycloclasticus sp.]|nr:hypothetical protein [Cycloclasticus sp.]
MLIDIHHNDMQGLSVDSLRQLLNPYKGGNCPVRIKVALQGASSAFKLADGWNVVPHDLLLEELKKSLPHQKSFIRY